MESPSARSEPYKAKAWWWARIKIGLRARLTRLGAPGALLLRGYRTGRWFAHRARWKFATLLSPSVRNVAKLGIDIDRVYWVDPATIRRCSGREFSLQTFKGRVIGGDWDVSAKNFEDLDIYLAMKQVCVEGGDWKNTHFYRNVLERVNDGEPLWGCRNPQELDQRLGYLQALFKSIKEEGWKTQEELRRARGTAPRADDDEVAVCIGRHGDLLFSDGAHRLTAAKLLRVPRIPVRVSVRHPDWTAFRKELLLYANDNGGTLYQPALHPDLENVPAFHDCDDRFRAIRDHLSAKQGNLLDIGANFGYFCHRFEDEGFTCHASENWPRELYFLRKLRAIGKKNFAILDESVLTCEKVRETKFDVVLALSVFHHFLKTRESFDLFVDMLRHLHTEEIFFQPHLPEDPQMRDVYRNLGNEEFVLLVQNNTGLQHCQLIGEFLEGRKLYRLSKGG